MKQFHVLGLMFLLCICKNAIAGDYLSLHIDNNEVEADSYKFKSVPLGTDLTYNPEKTKQIGGGLHFGKVWSFNRLRIRSFLDLQYIKANPDIDLTTSNFNRSTNSNIRGLSAQLNGQLELNIFKNFYAYIGAGAGAARLEFTDDIQFTNPDNPSDFIAFRAQDKTNFTYNLFLGSGYNLTNNLSVAVGYHFTDLGKIETEGAKECKSNPNEKYCSTWQNKNSATAKKIGEPKFDSKLKQWRLNVNYTFQ